MRGDTAGSGAAGELLCDGSFSGRQEPVGFRGYMNVSLARVFWGNNQNRAGKALFLVTRKQPISCYVCEEDPAYSLGQSHPVRLIDTVTVPNNSRVVLHLPYRNMGRWTGEMSLNT
jgi:hypothetical protein